MKKKFLSSFEFFRKSYELVLLITAISLFIVLFTCINTDVPRINKVLCNIFYSFIAAYLFYVFTILAPKYLSKKKYQPFISMSYKAIISKFEDMRFLILPVSNRPILAEHLYEFLLKYFLGDKGTDLTLKKIRHCIDKIERDCGTFLIEYSEYLTEKQILHINKIRNSSFWDLFGYYISICPNSYYTPYSPPEEDFKKDFSERHYNVVEKTYYYEFKQLMENIDYYKKYF